MLRGLLLHHNPIGHIWVPIRACETRSTPLRLTAAKQLAAVVASLAVQLVTDVRDTRGPRKGEASPGDSTVRR